MLLRVPVRDDEYARDPSTGTYTANYESQMTQPSVSQLMLDDRDAHSQAYVEAYAEPLSEAEAGGASQAMMR